MSPRRPMTRPMPPRTAAQPQTPMSWRSRGAGRSIRGGGSAVAAARRAAARQLSGPVCGDDGAGMRGAVAACVAVAGAADRCGDGRGGGGHGGDRRGRPPDDAPLLSAIGRVRGGGVDAGALGASLLVSEPTSGSSLSAAV